LAPLQGLFFGMLWFRVMGPGGGTTVTQSAAISGNAIIVMSSAIFGVIHMYNSLPTLFAGRLVFYREKVSRFYSSTAYSLALAVADLPWLTAMSLGFCCITYWMVFDGRGTAAGFFTYWLAVWLCGLYCA
jgi:ABC-type multidrug transport system permease subunit